MEEKYTQFLSINYSSYYLSAYEERGKYVVCSIENVKGNNVRVEIPKQNRNRELFFKPSFNIPKNVSSITVKCKFEITKTSFFSTTKKIEFLNEGIFPLDLFKNLDPSKQHLIIYNSGYRMSSDPMFFM